MKQGPVPTAEPAPALLEPASPPLGSAELDAVPTSAATPLPAAELEPAGPLAPV